MNALKSELLTVHSTVQDAIGNPAFSDFGRLLFPVDLPVQADWKLGDVAGRFPWYSCIRPQRTVSIINELVGRAEQGETIFYDIYTEAEKKRDSRKYNTGLFFFRGRKGAKTAICNAGGGFMYVAALQDSLPHAQALSHKGFNAFVLIYRPGWKTACEDLARAISFLWEHTAELQIDMKGYSLWGGSAGARMSAWLGSFGTENFGSPHCPRAGAVIMQYTGLDEVYGNEPPTYNWAPGTPLPTTASWKSALQQSVLKGRKQLLKFSRIYLMALALAKEPWLKAGWTGPRSFGRMLLIHQTVNNKVKGRVHESKNLVRQSHKEELQWKHG